jgi:hypothetical protein
MQTTLHFDPTRYPEPVLRLLLAAAEQWQCTPGEAEARILEQRARKESFVNPRLATTQLAAELEAARAQSAGS